MATATLDRFDDEDDKWDGSDIEPSPVSELRKRTIEKLNNAYYLEYSEGDRFS
jgi:hypothetical protein